MDLEKKIHDLGGKIIKKGEDIFTEHLLECSQKHRFKIFSNDIMMGKWCKECENDSIKESLEELGIDFSFEDSRCDYLIEGKRKFMIFKKKDLEVPADYNKIVVDNLDDPDLKQKIWEAVKSNQKFTFIGERKKETKPAIHQCEIITHLSDEKDDTGSVIKEAPPPYPANTNLGVGYIRVSTVMQVQDGFSLEAQESKICHEAMTRNIFIKKFYIDKGISGGSLEKRLALEKMRQEYLQGEWIISCSVSRLSRNTKDLLSLAEEVEKRKSHLLIIDLNMDITSPSGKLILTLMASQAQFEREQTSERVKGVLQHLKKNGRLRTKAPFGWKINPDRSPDAPIHIRDESEQKIIKKIRLLRSKYPDLTITPFTEKLNTLKVATPRRSKKWHHSVVRSIMEREGIK